MIAVSRAVGVVGANVEATAGRSGRALRRMMGGMLIAFAVQFLLGMLVNLFVQIPAHHPGVGDGYFGGAVPVVAWALLHASPALRLHVLLGIILGLGGLAVLVRAITLHRPEWIWAGAVALFGLLASAGNGISFLIFGRQFSSFFMALGFTVAAAAYVAAIATAH